MGRKHFSVKDFIILIKIAMQLNHFKVMHKFRLIGRIDINNENVVKGKCLEGLRKIGNPKTFHINIL